LLNERGLAEQPLRRGIGRQARDALEGELDGGLARGTEREVVLGGGGINRFEEEVDERRLLNIKERHAR
jgi:hypothetical protein